MAAESAPRDKMAHAIGLVQTAQRVAPAVGPVIGGILAQAVGLRNAFFVAGAVYGLAFALVSVLYRETAGRGREHEARVHVPMREHPRDSQPAAADGRDLRAAADRAQPRPGAAAARRVARLRRARRCWWACCSRCCRSRARSATRLRPARSPARRRRRVIATAIVAAAAGAGGVHDVERRLGADGRQSSRWASASAWR